MDLYLAPMEEVTGYVFRNVSAKFFGGVDKYFTPFITPSQKRILKTRDGREINPEHNSGLNVVPQILTKDTVGFGELAAYLGTLGYHELNINLGCPSNTVAGKGKGSGMLRNPADVRKFLDGVFDGPDTVFREFPDMKISVKTRLGYDSDTDFDELLEVYNDFPISELVIHPRIQKDFYKGALRMDVFRAYADKVKAPLCYNGDITDVSSFERISGEFPSLDSAMIGRGAVANPAIFREIRTGRKADTKEMTEFIKALYEEYSSEFGPSDAVFKMKEVWSYFHVNFPDSERELRKIQKAKSPADYLDAVRFLG